MGCSSSFNDWQFIDGQWSENHGVWSSQSKPVTYLVSRETFQDVRVTLEFSPDGAVNSGVFVRCMDPKDITALNCYEANIWDEHPNQSFRTGALVTRVEPQAFVETVGRWNKMEVIAVGRRIEVRVNNVLTALSENEEPQTGHIAFQQANEGRIQFRNVKLQNL